MVLRFFALQGRHVVPMGEKFDVKEWTHTHRCRGGGMGLQKLKLLLTFYRILEYECPVGHKAFIFPLKCENLVEILAFFAIHR